MTDDQFNKLSHKLDLVVRSNVMVSYMLKRLIHHIDKSDLDTKHEDWDDINRIFSETETMAIIE